MPINMKKYVEITSGTNNIQTATEKELIARIFTRNAKMPTFVIEFDSLQGVGEFFGTESEEYAVSQRYFNFINKYQRQPKKISFFRDYSGGGVAAFVYSRVHPDLNNLKAINDGNLIISMNDITKEITGIDLSEAEDLSAIASIIQAAIRAADTDEAFTNATFVYNDAGGFTLTAGTIGEYDIGLQDTELSSSLQIQRNQAMYSIGRPTNSGYFEVCEDSVIVSNNFATFAFLDVPDADGIEDIANWNKDNHPTEFMFVAQVYWNNKNNISDKVKDIDGVSLELCGDSEDEGKYNFVIPMAIAATTDYNRENGTVNYMYTQCDNVESMVRDDGAAKDLDELKINYYGQTQQAGKDISFYQNGVLQGDYQDQNIFVNEIWLKDALSTKILNYMLLTPNWYANKGGQAIGQGLATEVIERAKLNGTITTEKEISDNDKVYIYNITNDDNAWRQIYQEGYYLMTSIEKKTIDNQTKYVFNYTLLYSKGDSIKKVEGRDILI